MNRNKVLLAMITVLAVLLAATAAWAAEELAELYVTKIVLDPPSTIRRGEVVEVYARVMNTGGRTADGCNISFFYRHRDGSGNWTLQATEETVTIPPSHQDFHEVTFSLDTSELPLGGYELRVVADSANHIPETDELNNELRTTMTLVDSSLGLPDLQPVSLTYARSNPGATDDMEPWKVNTQVHNLGEVQAGQFVVSFLVDGEEFARQIRFVLPAGATADVSAELDPQDPERPLDPGTHTIAVHIDPADEVAEQNEGNNKVTGSLTLQSVELVPMSLVFGKALLRMDEEMSVTAEIRNDGEGVAKQIAVDFYAGHVRFGSDTIDILGRGMSAVAEATLDPEKAGLSAATGDYLIQVVVDPQNQLTEFDEANNTMTRTLTVHPSEVRLPELHPESIELTPPSPTEQNRANTVTVSSVLKNTGRAAAEGFEVSFAYRIKGSRRWETLPCSDDASCADVSLEPGAQIRLIGRLPVSGLGPGIYEIRILVDAGAAIDEVDESNNDLLTTLTLLASRSPDLAFCPSGVVVEPSTDLRQGQTVRITACLTNLGEQDAVPFTVRFSYCPIGTLPANEAARCSDPYERGLFSPASEIEVPGLAIGESTSVPVLLETRDLEPGSYGVRVEIDPGDSIRERNEANNIVSGLPIRVLGPDLAVVEIASVPDGVVDQASADRLDISATLINGGVVPTGEFTVRFRLMRQSDQGMVPVQVHLCGEAAAVPCEAPEYACEKTMSGIGLLTPVQVKWSLDLAETALDPGQYLLRVEIDCAADLDGDGICDGKIAEHNEQNNALDLPLRVLPRPADLQIMEPVDFPTDRQVDYGDVVPITATIINRGGLTARGACEGVPACGVGVEFVIQELGRAEGGGEQLLRVTPSQPIASLAPGERLQVTGLLDTERLDPFVTDYQVRIVVDPSHSIDELDETNNEVVLPLTVRPLPADLVIAESLQRYATEPVNYGQSVPIEVTVANEGYLAAADSCITTAPCPVDVEFVVYEAGAAEHGEQLLRLKPAEPIDDLRPGEQAHVTATLDTKALDPLISEYRLMIRIDPENRIGEIDETNNTIELPLVVRPLPADLIIAEALPYSPGEPVEYGQPVPIEATIANVGYSSAAASCVAAAPCTVGVEFLIYEAGSSGHSGQLLRLQPAQPIDDLQPGEEAYVSANLDTRQLNPLGREYRIRIRVDAENRVGELNESNNTVELPLSIRPLPADFVIAEASRYPSDEPRPYGQSVPIEATVANQGYTSAAPDVEFLVYPAAADMEATAPLLRLQPVEPIGVVSPGESARAFATLDTEELDPLGTEYRIRIVVDPNDRVDELDEANNTATRSLALTPLPPDLVIAGPIGFPEGTPVEYGEIMPITATIANEGYTTARGVCGVVPSCGIGIEFLVYEYDARQQDAERIVRVVPYDPILTLDPGEVVQVTGFLDTELLDPFMTSYRVCVRIDPRGAIAELDEANNERCTSPQLELYPPPPDLRLVASDAGEPLVRFTPAPPVEYGDQPVRAKFTVINDSRSPSGGFNIGLRLRRADAGDAAWIELDTLAVEQLGADEARSFSIELVLPPSDDGPGTAVGLIPPGIYEFCIVLDADGFVIERNEQNNAYCAPIGLVIVGKGAPAEPSELPDLRVRSLSAEQIDREAGRFRICATVENVGAAESGPFAIAAYYTLFHGVDPVPIQLPRSISRFTGLAPAALASVRGDFTIPNAEGGFYDVFVVVDSDNEVIECNEENNREEDSLWVH